MANGPYPTPEEGGPQLSKAGPDATRDPQPVGELIKPLWINLSEAEKAAAESRYNAASERVGHLVVSLAPPEEIKDALEELLAAKLGKFGILHSTTHRPNL
ncbi:MAG TPA: hypothetical protein VFH39_04220 [Candidatus Saccharimonadales bacterium]|nr:hypothetical protein [Candidatus Saccharimonadales bacterium]